MSKYKLYDFEVEKMTKDIASMINDHFSTGKILKTIQSSYPNVEKTEIFKITCKLRSKLKIKENLLDDYDLEETGGYWILTKGKSKIKIYKLKPNLELNFENVEVTRKFLTDLLLKIDQLDNKLLKEYYSLLWNFMKIDAHNYHG